MTEFGQMLEALRLADRLCKEALPKFNWGASALDANAIDLLNRAPAAIHAALYAKSEGLTECDMGDSFE